jgi:GNAT superfamily N-acetyltransferase
MISETLETNEITFRRVSVADIDSLVDICRDGFPNAVCWQGPRFVARKWWKLRLKCSSSETWVCLNEGRVAGFLGLIINQSEFAKENQKNGIGLLSKTIALMFRPRIALSRIKRLVISHTRKNKNVDVSLPSNVQLPNSDFSRGRSVIWIRPMAVSQHMRRRGLGKKILRFSEIRTLALHGEVLKLNVETFNDPAIRLYEKEGFTRTSEASGYIYYTKILKRQTSEK